jgi:EmrB/QacA subfamily drug resistance transporter
MDELVHNGKTSMGEQRFTAQQRWVLGLTAAASFVAVLDGMVVTTALDSIRQDLAAPLSFLHWTITVYSLSFASLLMAGAGLGDRFWHRSMFVFGLLLFALTSAGCAAATSIGWLVFARALQGAASAILVPVAMTLLGSAVTPLQRPRAMGMFSSLTGLAVLSGPVIGGLLVDSLGWRSVFWVNVPLCVATAFLATLKIQSSDRVMSKVDLPGVVLLTIAMTAIVWGLSDGNAIGWSSPAIASALAIGTASAIAFFVWETKALDALVPGRLMQSIPFRAGNLVCLLMFMSMMGTLIFMAQYFAITQQTSASGAGGRMTPWTVSLFVVAPISGILTSRLGERLPAVTGLLLQSAALMWMSFLCKSASGYGAWVPPLILAGVGILAGDACGAERRPWLRRSARHGQGIGHLQHHASARVGMRCGCRSRDIQRFGEPGGSRDGEQRLRRGAAADGGVVGNGRTRVAEIAERRPSQRSGCRAGGVFARVKIKTAQGRRYASEFRRALKEKMMVDRRAFGFGLVVAAGATPSLAADDVREANKRTVLAFYDAALNRSNIDEAAAYFGPHFIQHNPRSKDGIEGFRSLLQDLKKQFPGLRSDVKRVFADGDFVILHVHVKLQPEELGLAIVEIFRLEHGKIVEHWDVRQPITETAANTNGMF